MIHRINVNRSNITVFTHSMTVTIQLMDMPQNIVNGSIRTEKIMQSKIDGRKVLLVNMY